MKFNQHLNRRQFIRSAGQSLLGAAAAFILPSLHVRGIPVDVQDSSPGRNISTNPLPTPTPLPLASPPVTTPAEIEFLANHELIRGDTNRKTAMLTYDDARSNEGLSHLLDVFRENGVKTTIFIIGKDLESCKETLPRIIQEGHDLGCHGWSHDSPMTSLSDAALDLQFGQYLHKVNEIVPGYRMRFFRAPFGDRNPRVRIAAARWGLQHVLWSLESGGQDKQTYHNVVDRIQPGEIVLSHETRYFDVNDADVIVRELIRKGYTLESLSMGMSPADRWNPA